MKKILILIAIITILKVTTGADSTAERNLKKFSGISTNDSTIVPQFTELDGNLFLAFELEDAPSLNDGDVIEFDFGGRNKLVSFHVNDINQNIIDSGKADVFVMIHQDLALELKNERLNAIKIKSSEETITLPIKQRWQPDQYIVSL